MPVTIDETYLVRTMQDLVRIDSSNPSLTPGSPGEEAVAAAAADAMRALGLDVAVQTLAPGRANVVGIRRGSGGGRSLMWNGHLDTVGVEGMEDPFSAGIRDGRMHGRGTQDMKGSLAAMLAAAKALADAGIRLAGDLLLTAVADEEHLSIGTEAVLRSHRADAAIVTEPTDLALGLAHRGIVWFDVETFGRAAHGSRFREGIDAIMHMGRFLAALDGLEKELRLRTPHELLGPPSLHASIIRGGTELSTYPAHCRLRLERRTILGETLPGAAAELQAIVDRLSAEDTAFRASVKATQERRPFSVPADAPIVKSLERAAADRLGRPPRRAGATFWTDAALLQEAGIDAVLFGPAGQGLHSTEEWVDIASCVDLAAILAETAIDFCGTGAP